MDVSVEPFLGRSVHTGKDVAFEQYRIRGDGMSSGYVGFKPGSKVLLTSRFSPIQRAEIEKQVAEIVQSDSAGSSQIPDVPDDVLNPPEEDDLDDLDP